MNALTPFLSLLLFLTAAPAQKPEQYRQLELRGEVRVGDPDSGQGKKAFIWLQAADNPFHAWTPTDSRGRFRFKELPPGTYSLQVRVPGWGEQRRTLDVTPSFADSEGRVTQIIHFDHTRRDGGSDESNHTVSVRRLSIPDKALSEFRKAMKDLNRHEVEKAVARLKKAVDLAPHFAEAWNQLGTIAYQSSAYQDARNYFEQALEADPAAYEPLVNLGGTLLSLGDATEALAVNQRATDLRPEDPLAHSQLGLSHLFLGEDEKAIQHLSTSRSIDPAHFSFPQLSLASIYLRRNRPADALAELREFLQLHPDVPRAQQVQAQIAALEKLLNNDSAPP